MKILLSGKRSFAAEGLADLLRREGHSVVEVSAGEDLPEGAFDAVVNLGLRRDAPCRRIAEDALALAGFAAAAGVELFVQVSSLAVYGGSGKILRPATEISPVGRNENGYAAMKKAQDAALLSRRHPFKLIFVRPGVLFTETKKFRSGGLGVRIGRLGIILGDARTGLVVCRRDVFQAKIAELLCAKNPRDLPQTVLLGENTTKKAFLEAMLGGVWLPLPRRLTLLASKILLPRRLHRRVCGLFSRALLAEKD